MGKLLKWGILAGALFGFFGVFYYYNVNLTKCTFQECNDDKSECSKHEAFLLKDEIAQFEKSDLKCD